LFDGDGATVAPDAPARLFATTDDDAAVAAWLFPEAAFAGSGAPAFVPALDVFCDGGDFAWDFVPVGG
jgi:hypothetical protein